MRTIFRSFMLVAITITFCAVSADRFSRSPRPPGTEVAQIGEAKLAEIDRTASQIGENIESVFFTGKPAINISSGQVITENGENSQAPIGPVGPPRGFDSSAGKSPGAPMASSENCNHEDINGNTPGTVSQTIPNAAMGARTEPTGSYGRSSANQLGPARSFDTDFSSGETLPAGPPRLLTSRTFSTTTSEGIPAPPSSSERPFMESFLNSEPRSSVTFREVQAGSRADGVRLPIKHNTAFWVTNPGSTSSSLKKSNADNSHRNAEYNYNAENADYYGTANGWIQIPPWRSHTYNYYNALNQWYNSYAYYGMPWQPPLYPDYIMGP